MSTITIDQENAIREYLEGKHIPTGLGTEEGACSIAAINLALSGKLTDDTPDCMSPVIGKWIRCIQDAMPDDMRNSAEWRAMLPLAAGTGRELEVERAQIILDWMWETVLPYLQDLADKGGYGPQWKAMTTEKTVDAAYAASIAAAYDAAPYTFDRATGAASHAADAAYYCADTDAASFAGSHAAVATTYAASHSAVAGTYATSHADAAAWKVFDPASLLKKLIG